MKVKLLLAAVCIFSLPSWSSPDVGDRSGNPVPYLTVAYAGHTVGGNRYCQCGTEKCECDPGEKVISQTAVTNEQPDRSVNSNNASSLASEAGLGLFALTLLLFLLRLKS